MLYSTLPTTLSSGLGYCSSRKSKIISWELEMFLQSKITILAVLQKK
uniref:Uncharacterized protein n=1 Tax=Arundo donax TaxID=35708 RepID=A0A0A9HE91_ARUDO